jgi:hypothetical protein
MVVLCKKKLFLDHNIFSKYFEKTSTFLELLKKYFSILHLRASRLGKLERLEIFLS